MKTMPILVMMIGCALLGSGCATMQKASLPVDTDSSRPGATVTQKGTVRNLIGSPIEVGRPLPATKLVEASTMQEIDLASLRGSVLFLSIVPSIDTKVCEAQTHYLGEEGDRLPAGVKRITVSRDTPFAQKRFAEEAKLEDVAYYSDYKEGAFGRATGLLVEGPLLLARSVVLVDKTGIVRYIQVVPELTHLPDMETAFRKAEELLAE